MENRSTLHGRVSVMSEKPGIGGGDAEIKNNINKHENILRQLCATDCPVLVVQAKINWLISSDVINQSKSIDLTTSRYPCLYRRQCRTFIAISGIFMTFSRHI